MNARTLCVALALAGAACSSAAAQDFLNQDWTLDPRQSHVWMQTTKQETTVEKHQFTAVEGGVTRDGRATVKIELGSIDTSIDLRNVRMRFLLFETFKFPHAEIFAQLNKARLEGLAVGTTVQYPLLLNVNMHGVASQIETTVAVKRVNDTMVSVATVTPIVVTAESFDFAKGLVKLSDAVGGIKIKPSAEITFDLVFGSGNLKPDLDAARVSREQERAKQETAALTVESCENRLLAMTESNAIYFRTGSAELDAASSPLLDSGADIANRCPTVKFDVEGHTDSVGSRGYNQKLSQERAKSVVDYLTAKGVAAARIQSAGYGKDRPVASNDTEDGRARNRRIEFKARKE
jgi:outer membrane protein OmpA-like peptidoglycan-associated protein